MDLVLKTPQSERDRFKRYYQANKARYAALSKKWWSEHPEQLRAKWRRKYAKNKAVHQKRSRERRLKNLDHVRAVNREWQKRNWVHRQQYIKDYYRKNAALIKQRTRERYKATKADPKEKLNAAVKCAKRRATLKNATIGNTDLIRQWMASVKAKPVAKCYYCDKEISTKKIHFDHIKALNDGGAHCVENLCVSCPQCNWSKNDTPIQSWHKLGQQVFSL